MTNKLTKHFYDKSAILIAINAYKDLASISFSEDNEYFYYKIESNKYDPTLVANEFENYILGLMNA